MFGEDGIQGEDYYKLLEELETYKKYTTQYSSTIAEQRRELKCLSEFRYVLDDLRMYPDTEYVIEVSKDGCRKVSKEQFYKIGENNVYKKLNNQINNLKTCIDTFREQI